MSGETSEPRIRVRINHTHTAKDGWKCNETTVEVNDFYPTRDGDIRTLFRELMEDAHALGKIEADRRNSVEDDNT